jgi:hypothetical protein
MLPSMDRSIQILSIVLLLTFASVVSAQTPLAATKTQVEEVPVFTCGLPFDRYGDLKFADEKARLDNFAIQITEEPVSIGYILMSAGQITFENETAERLDRAKSYIVNERKIDSNRVVTVDCGFAKELSIRLYIAPLGVTPVCIDSVEPLTEVKFTKRRPKASRKRR